MQIYKMLPYMLIALLFLLPLLTALIIPLQHQQQHPHHAFAQSTTTTNQTAQEQQGQTNQETLADDNSLRNSSSLTLTLVASPWWDPGLTVNGSLTTMDLGRGETVSNSLNLLTYREEPLSDAEIQIIVANAIGNTIINTTSVTTDSFGTFSTTFNFPSDLGCIPIGFPCWPGPFLLLDREVKVVAYFEGDENTFPTHDVRQVTIEGFYSFNSTFFDSP